MKLTQGCFSFLPDLTDDQIYKQGAVLPRQGLGGEHRVH
ncbi:ribulose bisphosphate carboxylase small subunit [Bradyrhizobium diazoefficiens]